MQNYSGYRTIRFERLEGHVLKVLIDLPESAVNAVDDELHGDLTRLFADLKREQEARAILLTGTGRAFSAGGNFDWFPSLDNLAALQCLRRDAKQMIWDLLEVEVPIIAALNGSAAGLGASLALLCDIIFMSEKASILDPHVKVGIVAGDGGTAIWPLVVGPALAKQYLLTGDPVPAADALRMGLINFVSTPDNLLQDALDFARRIASGAPLAVQYTKAAVNKLIKDALNTSFDFATASEIVTFQSEDHKEALAAIAEKREPRFKGC